MEGGGALVGKGDLNGAGVLVLLVVIQHLRQRNTCLWFAENVRGFDERIYEDCCADKWEIVRLPVSPRDSGFNRNARDRFA